MFICLCICVCFMCVFKLNVSLFINCLNEKSKTRIAIHSLQVNTNLYITTRMVINIILQAKCMCITSIQLSVKCVNGFISMTLYTS